MKRHAIFVDAGYVFAQGSVSLSGSKTPRTQLKLDATEIIAQLTALALAKSVGVPLLRTYWYDGAGNRPTTEHLLLANMDNVKLRLGSINSAGEQKEADTVHEIAKVDVSKFLKVLTPAPPKPAVALGTAAVATGLPAVAAAGLKASTSKVESVKTIDQVIDEAILQTLAPPYSDISALKAALADSTGVPMEYDRRLLGTCRTLLQRDLSGDERREMRLLFKKKVLTPGPLGE